MGMGLSLEAIFTPLNSKSRTLMSKNYTMFYSHRSNFYIRQITRSDGLMVQEVTFRSSQELNHTSDWRQGRVLLQEQTSTVLTSHSRNQDWTIVSLQWDVPYKLPSLHLEWLVLLECSVSGYEQHLGGKRDPYPPDIRLNGRSPGSPDRAEFYTICLI